MNIKHKLNILDNILTESRQSNIKTRGSNIDGYLLARSRNKYVKISVCYKIYIYIYIYIYKTKHQDPINNILHHNVNKP